MLAAREKSKHTYERCCSNTYVYCTRSHHNTSLLVADPVPTVCSHISMTARRGTEHGVLYRWCAMYMYIGLHGPNSLTETFELTADFKSTCSFL